MATRTVTGLVPANRSYAYHHAPSDAVDDILSEGLQPVHHQRKYRSEVGIEPPATLGAAERAECDAPRLRCRASVERALDKRRPESYPERDGSVFLYPASFRDTAESVVYNHDDLTLLRVRLDPEWSVWQARSDFFGRPLCTLLDAMFDEESILNMAESEAIEWYDAYWDAFGRFDGDVTLPMGSGAAMEARPELVVPHRIPADRITRTQQP